MVCKAQRTPKYYYKKAHQLSFYSSQISEKEMNKGLAILIIVATLGLGYYLYEKSKKTEAQIQPITQKTNSTIANKVHLNNFQEINISGIASNINCQNLTELLQNWNDAKESTLKDIEKLKNPDYVLVSVSNFRTASPELGGYQVMTKEYYEYTKPWQPHWTIISDWQTFMNQRLQYIENNIQKIKNALKKCQK